MAAKKSTAKKTSKKAAVKKATKKVAAANKKTNVKKAAVKKQPKVEKTVEKKSKPISATAKPKSNTWVLVTAILIVIAVILVAAIGWVYFGNKDAKDDVTPVVELTPVENGTVKLLVVEDPSCTNCQVDLFATQVKANLIPELVIEKVDFNTEQGKAIISSLGVKQVPVYLFSQDIDKRDDWAEQLSGAFIASDLSGQKYYMLNPQLIPTKVMIEEPVITDSAIVIGEETAPVTITYFTDFECPFCAIAEGNAELVEQFKVRSPDYVPPVPKIMEEYVETGKVKIVFYNNPIASLHPLVRSAHLAGLCADEQGKFEEFERMVWTNRATWTEEADRVPIWKEYAKELELDTTQFDECLDSKKYDSQIEEELALGVEYGVSGTPAFFVGKSFVSGAQSFEVFQELIEAELAQE